jgi:flagellar protein FlgJ
MSLPIVSSGPALTDGPKAPSQRDQLRGTAQQFEALLLRQMLSSARTTDFGGNDLFGDQKDDTFTEMRDAQFADIASKSGQIGFAATIEDQLARFLPKDSV